MANSIITRKTFIGQRGHILTNKQALDDNRAADEDEDEELGEGTIYKRASSKNLGTKGITIQHLIYS